jgi:hypothetical protein
MHKRLFPQRFLPDLGYFGEAKNIYKFIFAKNTGKTSYWLSLPPAQ